MLPPESLLDTLQIPFIIDKEGKVAFFDRYPRRDDSHAQLGGQGTRRALQGAFTVLDPQQGQAYYRRILDSPGNGGKLNTVGLVCSRTIARAGERP